jgi:nucleoside phosphorylase
MDPELSSVLKVPWGWKKEIVDTDGTIYYRGAVSRQDGTFGAVIAACAPRMGMVAASVLASKMVNFFRPQYLACCGITAGIRGQVEIGDIIAADPSWDWGSGKRLVKEGIPTFAAAPHQIGLNSFLRGKLALMSRDQSLLDQIRRDWVGPKTHNVLRMHVGPVASGSAVLADATLAESLIQQHRKLIGIEMETYGVFAAAEESPIPQPAAFSIKSVSDFADSNKSDDFHEYAAYTSAGALMHFAEKML